MLVNNAGGSPGAEAATHSTRFFDKIIELNLSAAFYCAQAANARMQEQPEGGSIVNIASVAAQRASPGTAAYGAAKAGLVNLTQSARDGVGPEGPGQRDHRGADRNRQCRGALRRARRARASRGEPAGATHGRTRRYRRCVPLLASPLAAYVSGAALAVHGGGERPSFLDLALDRDRT